MSNRHPVNLRMKRSVLHAIKKECDRLEMSLTEWIEHACIARLGNEEEATDKDGRTDKERIDDLEKQVSSIWSAINYAARMIEENQDNIERVDDLELRMGKILDLRR